MYRLLNWLFGWDYVRTSNDGVCRVLGFVGEMVWVKTKDGRLGCTDVNCYEWLTCKPSKYIKEAE